MSSDLDKIIEREKAFWDKRHENIPDDETLIKEVESYADRAISPLDGGKDIRFFDQIHFLTKHFEGIDGQRVLEPACGRAMMGCFLAKYKNCFVEGFDIAEKGIEIAERRKKLLNLEGKINFSVQSFYETNFPDEHFDMIFGNTLHHMHDLHKIGKEMSRVLKKGGKAVFVEPYGQNFLINFVREHYLFGTGGGSPDERGNYITDEKVKMLASYFSDVHCESFRFFMMAARNTKSVNLVRILQGMDSMIKHIPGIEKFFGFIGIVLHK